MFGQTQKNKKLAKELKEKFKPTFSTSGEFIGLLQAAKKNNQILDITFTSQMRECIEDKQFQSQFRDAEGISLLFTQLSKLLNQLIILGQEPFYDSQVHFQDEKIIKIEEQIDINMQSVRLLLDCRVGIQQVLLHQSAVYTLFRVLGDVHSEEARCIALFIISVLSLLPPAFYALPTILNGLEMYSSTKGVSRFQALLQLGRLGFIKESSTTAEQMMFFYEIYIIITNLTKSEFNVCLQSRMNLRSEIQQAGYELFDKQVSQQILKQLKIKLGEDKVNNAHPVFKVISEQTLQHTRCLEQLDSYVSDQITPEIMKQDQLLLQILTLLTVRNNFNEQELSDQRESEFRTNIEIQSKDLNFDFDELLDKVNDSVQSLQSIDRANFQEALLNLLSVTQQQTESSHTATSYIFESLKNFSNQLVNFKHCFSDFGLEQAFNIDAEGSQLSQLRVTDVLSKYNKLTAYQILNELEVMTGKPLGVQIQQLYKNIQTFDKPRVQLISEEKLIELENFQQILKEKQLQINNLYQQNMNLLKENKICQHGLKVNNIKYDSLLDHDEVKQILKQFDQDKKQNPAIYAQNCSDFELVVKKTNVMQPSSALPPPPTNAIQSNLPPLPPPPPSSKPSSPQLLPPPPTTGSLPPPPMAQMQSSMSLPPPPPSGQLSSPPMVPGQPKVPGPGMQCPVPGPVVPGSPIVQNPAKQSQNILEVRVRPLMWDKLKDNEVSQESVWKEICRDDIKFNEYQLRVIGAAFMQSEPISPLMQSTDNLSASLKKQVQLLDARKSQQLQILLQKYKSLSIDQIIQRILYLQPLSEFESGIETLVQACPSEAELQQCAEFKDFDQLAKPEQFIQKLSIFPYLQQRLNNWKFMGEFSHEISKFRPVFTLTQKFLTIMNENQNFLLFLKHMVSVGNTLNANTPRGQAYGFKLKSLGKFLELKDSRGSCLVNFIIQMLNKTLSAERKEYIAQLGADPIGQELKYLNDNNYPLQGLQELIIITQNMQRTNYLEQNQQFTAFNNKYQALKQFKQFMTSTDDKYEKVVQQFLAENDKQINSYINLQKTVETLVEKSLQRYCEKSFDDFCKYICDFAQGCAKEIRDVQDKAELEKKNKLSSKSHLRSRSKILLDDQSDESLMRNLMQQYLKIK
ncbi:Formin_homology 2 domain-containing protein [Hexamita inflata]|uniref:Formin homology 2 domain-containing protein n=1 Tax=Hexamita inflata TaxID=28002 RepID=A0AA86U4U7_9EUKA|nr:Formin homology 2 domain-containing protein [Hexamita inflata]